ncbi:V-type ATP synthase subunit D [Paramaledivibacter caminithermalis]|jgi:V/A-type H+-transporting ATPase subunit D|uniref:V-type ATP synthase subunit D n=1 Tax=Paramaledivibacter caminithermalis (strain DSM 15212 / CIP 107654 / DViRD3) TaxID=1121301 RepID=A0A1M6L1F3_PARC5|nr:V-type ATP synthase subunit D [Paramaledivibacter caminithermalis]SHJ64993.1 V/A-type H+-transporting ATPase subunit D [Paramaledivibacter caminithermalis DSM 15212]
MENITPTKANLIKAKSLLDFSEKGYNLLDKKRSVLVREMIGLIDKVKDVQNRIADTFEDAYRALQVVNITMGVNNVEEVSMSIPKVEEYEILLKSIMGVEIPTVKFEKKVLQPYYGFFRTNPAMDIAVTKFREVKYLIYELSEIENSVYKLAMEIKKTQKRANALEKIQIPKYRSRVKSISEALEEKEREDFFRLKKVKKRI